MGLIQCPDCGKQISDSAPTCISCGRKMGATSPNPTQVVETKGRKLELIGFLIILAAMGGCSVGMVTTDGGPIWLGIGVLGFLVGICIFVAGRFH